MSEQKKHYFAGAALLLLVAAFILTVFALLGRTDKTALHLEDTREERSGWRYDLMVDGRVKAYTPRFADQFALAVPPGTQAVRITRTMTETVELAELEWICDSDGVEVFLDGELFYSDFPQLARDADGFVHPTQEQWDRLERARGGVWQRVRMSMPEDYVGKELTVVTYFPDESQTVEPEYPSLGNDDSAVAGIVTFSAKYVVILTVYALLALAMAGVFLLDIRNSGADGRTLLLCLYFLLLFLDTACGSSAGYYSVLSSRIEGRVIQKVYMMPLYLYLALRMEKWWKWPLCAGVTAWAAYECAQEYLKIRSGLTAVADSVGLETLLVLLAVTTAFCAEGMRRNGRTRLDRKALAGYGLVAAAVTAAYVAERARAWDGLGSYLRDGVWTALCLGNYWPVVTLATDIISYVTVIAVVTEFVRRTVRTRRTVDVLRERSRLTLAGYERMLRAEESTNAAKHEMRHHMTALAGLLRDGDLARAREYVSSVTDALDRLPTMRYSSNVLVNTIAGAYLDQAKAQGIGVEYNLMVPAELNVADEDLSVFLTNLLENALHACQRLGPDRKRYIRLNMALQENFLFIGCMNSAPDEQETEQLDREEQAGRQHGYGLEAMRQIAEKYGSMLLLERTAGSFSVRSNFNLRPGRALRSSVPPGQ